jgi:hypothetical protein
MALAVEKLESRKEKELKNLDMFKKFLLSRIEKVWKDETEKLSSLQEVSILSPI